MESNTSKLASNINDESDVPIEKPIDIPNFTIEEAVVRSNVTSPHSKTTGHGKNTVTPKPTKATGLSSTSTSDTINYTTGPDVVSPYQVLSASHNVTNMGRTSYINVLSSSSLNLNGIAKKVGDELVEPINECPSIYSIKLSSTSSIMATLRKLDANVPNDADYDIWLPKASVHEGIDLMLRDGSWMIIEVPIFLNKQSPSKKSGGNGGTINFKPVSVKPETQYILKVNLTNTKVFPKTASTVGKKNGSPLDNSSEKTNMPNATTSGNGIFPLLLEEKCVLVDEDGKPLEKVDYSGDHGSEDDFAHVDNEMASFLAKTSGVGYGTKSMLEQWRKTYGDVEQEYDYDSYDDDMYEGQVIPDNIQTICNNMDIKVRGRLKK
ncbi:hypothetical protein Tco_0778666 [Tanacetum coccineum]